MKPLLALPEMICFRVTRDCNARCRFCLAPPEGEQPDAATLKNRIDWLLAHGVKTIHFCGGEPTIHPALAELFTHVHERGGKSRLTTNAIAIPDTLLPLLRTTATEVKVSLHGDQEHHNAIMGVTSFQHTIRNIKRLISARVNTSIQSTVVAGQNGVVDWLIVFCLESGVRRLSLLPFIPRGNGNGCSDEFALTPLQRRELRDQIKKDVTHSTAGSICAGSISVHSLFTWWRRMAGLCLKQRRRRGMSCCARYQPLARTKRTGRAWLTRPAILQ